MNSPAIDPRLIDALHQASSLELFQLGAVIDLMLRDPRRIAAVRGSLQLGQTEVGARTQFSESFLGGVFRVRVVSVAPPLDE